MSGCHKVFFRGKRVKVRNSIRGWSISGLLLVLAAGPSLAEQHHNEQRSAPAPSHSERQVSRPPSRTESHPRSESRPQSQSAPRDYRSYQPPRQGHHSGQWLNQHRDQPLDQQRRALERDPQFRRLSPQHQQQLEQGLQRFVNMPRERQQQVLQRMETWEHLTPQQKQDFRGMGQHFNSLPADRKHAVRSAIESLRAMPPSAREREIDSGRFRQFSPEEKQILNDASRLPLAPAPAESSGNQPEQQNPGSQRYVPRPPR